MFRYIVLHICKEEKVMTARPNIQLIVDNAITKVAAEIANHAPGDKGDLSKETQTLLALDRSARQDNRRRP